MQKYTLQKALINVLLLLGLFETRRPQRPIFIFCYINTSTSQKAFKVNTKIQKSLSKRDLWWLFILSLCNKKPKRHTLDPTNMEQSEAKWFCQLGKVKSWRYSLFRHLPNLVTSSCALRHYILHGYTLVRGILGKCILFSNA